MEPGRGRAGRRGGEKPRRRMDAPASGSETQDRHRFCASIVPGSISQKYNGQPAAFPENFRQSGGAGKFRPPLAHFIDNVWVPGKGRRLLYIGVGRPRTAFLKGRSLGSQCAS